MNIASVDQISISRSNVQSADIIIGTVISEFKNLDKTQLNASIFFCYTSVVLTEQLFENLHNLIP